MGARPCGSPVALVPSTCVAIIGVHEMDSSLGKYASEKGIYLKQQSVK